VPPRAAGRPRDRRAAAGADRTRPGARRPHRRRPQRARLHQDAAPARQAPPRVRSTEPTRRLPLPRSQRPGPLHRPCPRPARAPQTPARAARALTPDDLAPPAPALPPLPRRLRELADARRFEDAALLRDRIAALERVCRELERLDRVRRLACCILVPATEPA